MYQRMRAKGASWAGTNPIYYVWYRWYILYQPLTLVSFISVVFISFYLPQLWFIITPLLKITPVPQQTQIFSFLFYQISNSVSYNILLDVYPCNLYPDSQCLE